MNYSVLIYTRVSSSRQEEDGTSLDTQLAACRQYAAERGWEIAGEYQDVWTGSQFRERPGLTKLREQLRTGTVDVILCYALDRLSRDQTHVAVLVDQIEHHGARLELVTESFEDTAVGKFIRSATAFASEVEREKIILRSSTGRRARVAAGKPLPGPRPMYGYRWADEDKSRLQLNPDTAPVMKRIYEDLANRKSALSIARCLTEEGIPTPSGRNTQWRSESIREMVRRPHYCGRPVGWVNRELTRAAMYSDAPDSIPLPEGTYPAIVSEELWMRANDELQRRKVTHTNNGRNQTALLVNGFARCAYCGRPMATKWWMRRYQMYACNGDRGEAASCAFPTMSVTKLDSLIWEGLKERLSRPEIIIQELRRYRSGDPTREDLAEIRSRIQDVDRKLSNLARRLSTLDDADLGEYIVDEMKSLKNQRQQLEVRQHELEQRQIHWETSQEHLDRLEEWCQTVAASLDDLDYDERRALFAAIDLRVTVWKQSDRDPRYHVEALIDLDSPNHSTIPDTSRSIADRRVVLMQWPDRRRRS